MLRTITLAVVLTAALGGTATFAAENEPGAAPGLMLRCDEPTPSLRTVAEAFAVDNYDRAYDLRLRLHAMAQRACAGDVRGVFVAATPGADGVELEARAMAEAEPR